MLSFRQFLSEAIRPQPLSSGDVRRDTRSAVHYNMESHGEKFQISAERVPSPGSFALVNSKTDLPLTRFNFIEVAFKATGRINSYQRTNRNTDQFAVLTAMLSLTHYVVTTDSKIEYVAYGSKNDRLRAYRMVLSRLPYLTEVKEWKNYTRDYTYIVLKVDRSAIS